jgi:signal transduction histidine kinase
MLTPGVFAFASVLTLPEHPGNGGLPRVEEAAKPTIDCHEVLRRMRIHWLSHIVHEMRGPLFAARGYTKLLLDERGGAVTVTQRQYLTTLIENINKIAISLNGLQEFPAQEELNLELLDITQLLYLAVADWRVKEKTLQLSEHISCHSIVTAGDSAKLSFAVHKLLGAMVEFSRYGGKIDVYARREEDEFLMRMTAAVNGPAPGAEELAAPPDLARPCEILRLHGGLASADYSHPGVCNVTVRLPLIQSEYGEREMIPGKQR